MDVEIHSFHASRIASRPEYPVMRAVALGAQGDHPGREAARGRLRRAPVHDRHRPLAIDVDVVAGGVEVPRAHARWPATDLREAQPLGPKNHSMCVADVPIPSSGSTRRPSALTSS